MGLLGPFIRQGVTQLQLFKPEECAIAHPPGTGSGIILIRIRTVTGPQGIDITVVLAPMAVRIGFQQLGVVIERSRTGRIGIDERLFYCFMYRSIKL